MSIFNIVLPQSNLSFSLNRFWIMHYPSGFETDTLQTFFSTYINM